MDHTFKQFDSFIHTKYSQEDLIGEGKDHYERDSRAGQGGISPERTFFSIATSSKLDQSEFRALALDEGLLTKAIRAAPDGKSRANHFGGKLKLSHMSHTLKNVVAKENKDPTLSSLRRPAGSTSSDRCVASALAMRHTWKAPGDPSNFKDIGTAWSGCFIGQGHFLRHRETNTFWYTLGYRESGGWAWRVEELEDSRLL